MRNRFCRCMCISQAWSCTWVTHVMLQPLFSREFDSYAAHRFSDRILSIKEHPRYYQHTFLMTRSHGTMKHTLVLWRSSFIISCRTSHQAILTLHPFWCLQARPPLFLVWHIVHYLICHRQMPTQLDLDRGGWDSRGIRDLNVFLRRIQRPDGTRGYYCNSCAGSWVASRRPLWLDINGDQTASLRSVKRPRKR